MKYNYFTWKDCRSVFKYTPIIKVNQGKQKRGGLPYNKPLTDRELKKNIKQKNAAPGEDAIYPQMIKRLPSKTLKYLLKYMYKGGKRPKRFEEQQTSCPNKYLKGWQRDKKLVWYLKKEKKIDDSLASEKKEAQ